MVRAAQACHQEHGVWNPSIQIYPQGLSRISRLEFTLRMQPTLIHHHLLIRAQVAAPPLRDFDLARALRALVKKIRMKILQGPNVKYCAVAGNRGWSGSVIIETSSITFHCWEEVSPAVIHLDIYSCAPFAVEDVMPWLQQFELEAVDYKFLDRERGFSEIK